MSDVENLRRVVDSAAGWLKIHRILLAIVLGVAIAVIGWSDCCRSLATSPKHLIGSIYARTSVLHCCMLHVANVTTAGHSDGNSNRSAVLDLQDQVTLRNDITPSRVICSSLNSIFQLARRFRSLKRQLGRFAFDSSKLAVPILIYRWSPADSPSVRTGRGLDSPTTVPMLFRVMLLFTLQTSISAETTQQFKILNPQGYETSYLYEDGKLLVTCSDDKNRSVQFNTQMSGNLIEDPPKETPFTKEVHLNRSMSLVKTKLMCDAAQSWLLIKPLLCNPFLMIPPVANCKTEEVCLLGNGTSAMCGKMAKEDCFLASMGDMERYYTASYPNPRVACVTSSSADNFKNMKTQLGLCHARVIGVKSLVGLASEYFRCAEIAELIFNGMTVNQDELLFTTKTPSSWTISYKSDIYDKLCIFYDSKSDIIANFSAGEKTEKLSLLSSKPNPALPTKIRLHCSFSRKTILFTISTFVIVYDKTTTLYKAEIKLQNSTEANALDLICSCAVPQGFICTLSWEKPDKAVELMKSPQPEFQVKKTIFEKNHAAPVTYLCFVQLAVSNYPVTFQLVKVPEIDVINAKRTVSKKDFKTMVQIPKGSKPNEVTTNPNSNSKDGNANDQSKSNNSKVPIIVGVVIGLVAIAVVCIIVFLVIRRRRKAKPELKQSQQKIIENQEKSIESQEKAKDVQAKAKDVQAKVKEIQEKDKENKEIENKSKKN